MILLCGTMAVSWASPTTLPTLHIEANKTKKNQKTPSNQYHFSQQSIRQTGAKTPTQFLTQQGILTEKGSSSSLNQSNISIHGFGNNASQNSLVLIDGVPYTSLSNATSDINGLMVQNIGGINILPGSYGARYGNQAVGGVVNIKTLQPPRKPIHQIQIGVGNNNQKLLSLFYSQEHSNHIGTTLGISGLQNDHSESHEQEQHYTINSKIDYVGARGNVAFNFLGYQNSIQIPAVYVLGGGQEDFLKGAYFNTKGTLTYVNANYYFTPRWRWNGILANNFSNIKGVIGVATKSNQIQWLLKNELHYQHYLVLGNQESYGRYGLQNANNNKNAGEVDSALYANSNIPILQQLTFNLGGRYARQDISANVDANQHHNRHEKVFVSTEGLTWHIHPNLTWYLRRAGNFVFAKSAEQMWQTNGENFSLAPQTGVSYETGIDWQPRHNEFKLSLYQLDLDNEIAINPEPGNGGLATYENLSPTRRLGMDAYAKIQLSTQFDAILQTTLVSAKFRSGQFKDKQVPSVSPYQASAGLAYHNAEGWQAWVNETYHSSFYAANDFNNTGSKLSGYFLTNLYLSKTWHAITVGLSINNLFNRRFARYAFYNNFNASTRYYLGDGISAMGTITLQF